MRMYSVELRLGQALVNAADISSARKYAAQEWGEHNGPYKVSLATTQDQQWVASMGGIVHEAGKIK